MNLSPEADYCLYGAFECLHITPDVFSWLSGDPDELDFDAVLDEPTRPFAAAVNTAFLAWWEAADLTARCAAIAQSVPLLRQQIEAAVTNVAEREAEAYVQRLFGLSAGPGVPLRDGPPWPEYRRVRRLTRGEIAAFRPAVTHLEPWFARMTAMAARCAATLHAAGGRAGFEALAARGRADQLRSRRQRHGRDLAHDAAAALDAADRAVGAQVLARSGELMDAVVGPGSVTIFFSGEELRFSGRRFQFVIRRNHVDPVLHSATPQQFHSVPYDFFLRTLDGEHLAKGCVVSEGTPMLDQITALFLNIKAGREEEVVRTTNWYSLADDFHRRVGALVPVPRRAVDPFRALRGRGRPTKAQSAAARYRASVEALLRTGRPAAVAATEAALRAALDARLGPDARALFTLAAPVRHAAPALPMAA